MHGLARRDAGATEARDDRLVRTPNRWVLVTGASGTLGGAVVARCIQDGLGVLAVTRSPIPTKLRWRSARFLRVVVTDLTSPSLEKALDEALDQTELEPQSRTRARSPRRKVRHRPPVLAGIVNVAGISAGGPIDELADADWHRSFEVNVTGPMRIIRCALPRMRHGLGASVVNVASPVALLGARKVSYAASKAALLGLTMALARDLGRYSIRVNAVMPGAMISKMTADWSTRKRSLLARSSCLGRLCSAQDVAGAVSFLLGPDSSYVTATIIDVTGGALAMRRS